MRRALLVALMGIVFSGAGSVAPALAAEAPAPWWWTGTEVTPSNLSPEHGGRAGEGTIVAVVGDLGDGPADGAGGSTVVVSDTLPAGLTASSVAGPAVNGTAMRCQIAAEAHRVSCSFAGTWYPYQLADIPIKVKVEEPEGTVTTLPNRVSVEGGRAPRATSSAHQVRISAAPTPFGAQEQGYELVPYSPGGTAATLAGSHPFQLTSTLVLNQTGTADTRQPAGLPRSLRFQLPLGLIGDPQAAEQCPSSVFTAHAPVSEVDECPPGSVVGVASVTIDEPKVAGVVTLTVPLFNLVPSEGEPARFGFEALGLVPVIIDTSLDPSDGYGVVASVKNATAVAGLLSSQVTIWGVPGDPRHDSSRGWECIDGGYHHEKGEVATPCPASSSLPETPLLTLPTSCAADPAAEPVSSLLEADSWTEPSYVKPPPYVWSGAPEEPLGFTGCEALPFEPAIGVMPETARNPAVRSASSPTGLTVTVRVPQAPTTEANPEGRAEADVRDTTVTLPAGVALNPSAANGLAACPESKREPGGVYEGVGFEGFKKFNGPEGAAGEPAPETAVFSDTFRFSSGTVKGSELPPSCPEASKVGLVHIKTPLLPRELEGAVYLAEPAPNGEAGRNPFDSLVALYLVAEDHEAGVLVKLAGKGELNQATGQITTSFQNTPQLPFEELGLELFGGQRASLSTPAFCGVYPVEAVFTPWSGTGPVEASSPLEVTSGAGGGACPSGALAFAPSFDAQSTSTQAGGFTSFQLELVRPDGDQAVTGLTVHLPPGVAALLSTLTPCQEPPAGQEWACGAESEIGQSTASSGLGSEPVVLAGTAYLTSGYDGAPFGLLVRTKAEAGPFDLGYVDVRSRIDVNPETAAVTITTDPGPRGEALPTMLKGIPVDLKRLVVNVDRPDFEFNPTSCEPTEVAGMVDGAEGASAPVSSRFQVGGCQSLPFHPVLAATVGGHASKADGTGFDVKITSAGLGQANIRKVDLQLPEALPSRDSTLNKACLAATFDANPAGCSEESVIGYATVHTPVLKSPLTGPAYLVSHGGAAFPDVEFVLQGEGITLVLDGKTQIKDGITYSKFESAPDAPFTSFETVLPAGPHSILGAYANTKEPYDLCSSNLRMPTTITAQDGAVIEQDTPITPTGCGAVLSVKARKLTSAQQLDKALAACRKSYRHSKRKRAACEGSARKRFSSKKTAHSARKTGAHHYG